MPMTRWKTSDKGMLEKERLINNNVISSFQPLCHNYEGENKALILCNHCGNLCGEYDCVHGFFFHFVQGYGEKYRTFI